MKHPAVISAMVETGIYRTAVAVVFAWFERPNEGDCRCEVVEPGVRAREFRLAGN
jgi:hypothetical protein